MEIRQRSGSYTANLFGNIRCYLDGLQDYDVMAHELTQKADDAKSEENFEKIKELASVVGVNIAWEFDGAGTIQERHIVPDHDWKISLNRGLDIFQHYEMNGTFAFANWLQQYRAPL